jgi:hypothetical protein
MLKVKELDPPATVENWQPGRLEVLFWQEPTRSRPFVAVRRWTSADGRHSDLLAEYGYVENNDLSTTTAALPFWWDEAELSAWLEEQGWR